MRLGIAARPNPLDRSQKDDPNHLGGTNAQNDQKEDEHAEKEVHPHPGGQVDDEVHSIDKAWQSKEGDSQLHADKR